MSIPRRIGICFAFAFALLCVSAMESVEAATFANFSADRHNRFLGDDSLNPNFWLDHALLTGVAVQRAVLISPQHYVTATHTGMINPTFVAADGTRHTYTADSSTILQTTLQNDFLLSNGTTLLAGTSHNSDLLLVKLDAPVPLADGITPLAVLGGGYFDMLGRSMIVQGQNSQFGSDTIDFTQTVELNTGAITESVIYRWDDPLGGGGLDELTLVGGDSGEGSFIELGGQYVFTGTNMGIATDSETMEKFSFNNFVSPYVDLIATEVSADGFSISVVAVPEPSMAWAMLTTLGFGWARRRTKRSRLRGQVTQAVPSGATPHASTGLCDRS
ncbi:PEP-CTERM sorting domain-containing protein [Rhodopirellula sp. P2]|uniref:PEP-CTERM sorting domain-containing protein n=1 Tax=Rhodopirellula sp. P2 TaxID=2127060 RepID=UPI002367C2D8|nr:PEP-CTERM sorting domain-containing protein [Rhodopirellula sp. P2]WDQ14662.1 PEP-CTERM sorting domain-containing protein [Rhodopirellula sp. P2]